MNNNEVGNSPGDDHDTVIRQKSVFASIRLAFSCYGDINLGQDDDQPEFSAVSWLTMLFATGDLNPGIYHPVWNTN